MPAFTNTIPDSGFIPRKEFIREQRTIANTFSLLTLSGSSCVRLYAFPSAVIAALRRLFDQNSLITTFRQDDNLNFCEFTLDGRPWVNSKSVSSEKLLIDILAVIFRHGHLYLSTIDYGRERDDRLAIAFSKSCFLPDSPIRSGSPVPASPDPGQSGSTTSHQTAQHKVAFALSFTSATRLRVISPPLDSTPAILQAVRGSWPRGVVSEKKVADATFEFKLKGYRWFQEDTFAADSLQHILSILSSLDTHSFSLLTSLSLSNRSRVKDLWIFTGPSSYQDLDSPAQSIDNTGGDYRRAQRSSPEPQSHLHSAGQSPQHRKYATSPNLQRLPHSPTSNMYHGKSATVGYTNHSDHDSPAVAALRKVIPKAQTPMSTTHDVDGREEYRATLPSAVSSDTENMTGVGTAASTTGWRGRPLPQPREVIYEPPPEAEGKLNRTPSVVVIAPERTVSPNPRSPSPNGPRTLRPVSTRAKTPPLLKSNPSSPVTTTANATPSPNQTPPADNSTSPKQGHLSASALLSPGVFRDSALSTSDASVEIPIKWTGNDVSRRDENESKRQSKNTPSFLVPGSWSPLPTESNTGEERKGNHDARNERVDSQAVQEVVSRVPLPEVTHPAQRPIKSEIGSVGIVDPTARRQSPSPPPPVPYPVQNKGKGKAAGEGSMQGWVLVNVEGKNQTQVGRSPETVSSASPLQSLNGTASPKSSKLLADRATMSAPAKTIAMVDAVEAKSKRSQSTKPSGLKRLFGFGKSPMIKENPEPRPRARPHGMATPADKRRLID